MTVTWAILVEGDKRAIHKRIHQSPLIPSRILETTKGFQVEWNSIDGVPAHQVILVEGYLVPFFGGRIAPVGDLAVGSVAWERPHRYTERQMVESFPYAERLLPETDSPIEQLFLREFNQLAGATHGHVVELAANVEIETDNGDRISKLRLTGAQPPWTRIAIIPQVVVPARDLASFAAIHYRIDFLVVAQKSVDGRIRTSAVAVECDGRDFHERTIDQAVRDRRRDSALLVMGIPTIRFMGTELHSMGEDCAGVALTLVLQQLRLGTGRFESEE